MNFLTPLDRRAERERRVRALTNEQLADLADLECVVPLDYEMRDLARDEMKRREEER